MNWPLTIGTWIAAAAWGWLIGWIMCARHTNDIGKRIAEEEAERRRPPMKFAKLEPGDD